MEGQTESSVVKAKKHVKKHQQKYTIGAVAASIIPIIYAVSLLLGQNTNCGKCLQDIAHVGSTDAGN